MTALTLDGRYGRTIVIDVCAHCNHVWFDGHEDLHLTPHAVIGLFEAMGAAAAAARTAVSARKPCPRCGIGLLRAHDRVRNTRFEYFRCGQDHGRYMSFAAFLRARHFVRDLNAAEVQALRADARVIKCVNCGASTDITAHSACAYCGAPIAILDPAQLAKTLAELSAAEATHVAVDPTWPLRAEQARRQTEAVFEALRQGRGASPEFTLIETGLRVFAGAVKGLVR